MIFHVSYLSDKLKVNGYLALPNGLHVPQSFFQTYFLNTTQVAYSSIEKTRDIKDVKLPAFIYCRGGIGRFGRVKMHWIEKFAHHNYVVFAPCYRGNEGSEGRDEFGGRDQNDVLAAYKIIRSFPFVDRDNISIMGFSRGSINATQAAVTIPDIKKLVLWSGVSDLVKTYDERVDLRRMFKRVVGGTPNKFQGEYEKRSPLCLAERINCPTLIIHGTEDTQVLVSHGDNMFKKLKELSKDVTYHKYEGYEHHFPFLIHHLAIKKMFDWIAE